MTTRRYLAAVIALSCSTIARAQRASPDSARCDSIVAAARVDSVPLGLFFTANSTNGLELPLGQQRVITWAVATAFMAPSPLTVGVFDGPAEMRTLRRRRAGEATELRTPSITGVYRFTSTKTEAIASVKTVRASLVTDLDAAMIAAIREASIIREVVELPPDVDSMRVEVRISTDSGVGSVRAKTLYVPRTPVVDAVPARDNPLPILPGAALSDSAEEVLLRFVVGPSGLPTPATVELARGRSAALVRAALEALPAQLFSPATIGGCAVSQVVYYSISFAAAAEKTSPRH
jgi:hypothetical protein